MPKRKINARDLIFEVSDMENSPTWTGVGGLTSATVSYDENEEVVDTTTFDSEGYYEAEKLQIGAQFEMEGLFLQDPTDGTRDAGQQLVEERAELLGYEGLTNLRFRYPGATTWKTWSAVISVGEQGGGTNDKTSWNATFIRSGAPGTAAVS